MIKDVAKGILVQLGVTVICGAAAFLVAYFTLDFAGAFEQFPREFSVLVVGCAVLIVVVIVWANVSARQKMEKSYSKKIDDLEAANRILKRDYDAVNHELLGTKATMVDKKKEVAIDQSTCRDKAWSQSAK